MAKVEWGKSSRPGSRAVLLDGAHAGTALKGAAFDVEADCVRFVCRGTGPVKRLHGTVYATGEALLAAVESEARGRRMAAVREGGVEIMYVAGGVLFVEREQEGLYAATARPARNGPLAEFTGATFTGATLDEAVESFEAAAAELAPMSAGKVTLEEAARRNMVIGRAADVGYVPGHERFDIDLDMLVAWPPGEPANYLVVAE